MPVASDGTEACWSGELDHIHLRIALPPNLDLSRFVNTLKTTSSRLLRKDFSEQLEKLYRQPVFSSRSYCIISCAGAALSMLKSGTSSRNEIRNSGALYYQLSAPRFSWSTGRKIASGQEAQKEFGTRLVFRG
jgi:hypothetical protein